MKKVCPVCNNKRHIFIEGKGWVRCQCVGEVRATRLMETSGFPKALWEISSETFVPGKDPNRKELADAILRIVKNYDKSPIFIYSQSIDSDRVAAIICRYLASKHEEVNSISYASLDKLVQKWFGKSGDSIDFYDPDAADITVVAIGKEITNKAHQNLLFNLLYDRILAEKFTIVCSSIPQERILQVYRSAVDGLMKQHFKFYSC